MGGYVALSLVARYPKRVRALMLMDTRAAADSPEAAAEARGAARAVLAAGSPGPVVDAMMPRLFAKMTLEQRPERVEPIKASSWNATRPEESPGPCGAWPVGPTAGATCPRSRVPTLVLVGEEDVITPPAEAQAMAEAIPDARLEVIPQAGHMAPYENPPSANAAILRFLRVWSLKELHAHEG